MKNPLAYVHYFKRLLGQQFPYEPLITVEISRGRLLHNLNEFRKLAPRHNGSEMGRIAPVLKSNAYGHGLFEIAGILEKENGRGDMTCGGEPAIPFFVVDSYFEAVALRSHGIKTPILIVGYTRPETIVNSRLKNIAFTITNIETLRGIQSGAGMSAVKNIPDPKKNPVTIHIKVDTGMRRQGILPAEIAEAITLIKKNRHLNVEGVLTHFSDADNADHGFTEKQIATWNEIAKRFKTEFPSLRYLHASATDGHRFAKKIDANVSRLGIGLYGLSDDMEFARKMNLQPVLQMKTIVTGIKTLKAGETTGYGNIFTAWKDTSIATIPVGYFEGLNRKLSNNGSVTAIIGTDKDSDKKTRIACPIVGRVSMNITTIEIPAGTKEKSIHIGCEIIAVSNDAAEPNSIVSIAKKSGTIAYEIVVHIPAHLKRIVL